jgi:hypothetical protein
VRCRAGVLEGFSGVSNLMAPEFATVFSAIIAITSVSINLYGGLLTEKRRAELAREVGERWVRRWGINGGGPM